MSVAAYVSKKEDCESADRKRTLSKIKEVWLTAIVLTKVNEDVQIIQVTRTQQLDW